MDIDFDSMTPIEGVYQFISKAFSDERCLDIEENETGDSVPLICFPEHGGDNQKFRLRRNDEGYYAIQAVHSDKVLDGSMTERSPRWRVIQFHPNVGPNQLWRFELVLGTDVEAPAVRIRTQYEDGYVLTPRQIDGRRNMDVLLEKENNEFPNEQMFTIRRVD